MALTRIRIENLDTGDVIQSGVDGGVFFNPNQYTIAKKVTWKPDKMPGFDVSQPQFDRGEPLSLSFSLLFDSYESRSDVRKLTAKVAKLTQVIGKEKRPPVVRIIWGDDAPSFAGLPFTGVVDSVTQKFTLFLDTGTPVRATLDLGLHETKPPKRQLKETPRRSSSPLQAKTRVVKQGDTIWGIAFDEYKDPALWRPIARQNQLTNPRELTPGSVLLIPSIG
jgi:Contractile injection system tube protein/LysM domain